MNFCNDNVLSLGIFKCLSYLNEIHVWLYALNMFVSNDWSFDNKDEYFLEERLTGWIYKEKEKDKNKCINKLL